jgi:hypothetical protein
MVTRRRLVLLTSEPVTGFTRRKFRRLETRAADDAVMTTRTVNPIRR